ncbi:xap5 domain containing protein [Grosmannia clavigera kw1407]|uniref:Xap5 domain containing protein n=1 Tax=Grosmannia clavigera (strain kw1407 / UAMH 11150) TaxID=655863 RepID=F0XJ04_GROCL|nr:xap5 domain containing protein [Grosmannia clavigera kw1407]EFX02397.1 xap5 domain containing protein [Grosmannia clavigera kw1407]
MSGLSGSRFTAPNQTTSDRLSTNTVGLVALSDFRKRRAEVIEQQEREAREAARGGASSGGEGVTAGAGAASGSAGGGSGSGDGNGATSGASAAGSDGDGDRPKTKKSRTKRDGKKGRSGGVTKLSFLGDEEGDEEGEEGDSLTKTKTKTESTETTALTTKTTQTTPTPALPLPKSFTKQALRRQAAEREALRKEFLLLQTAVKATEVAIPFVFYEGADIPGGVVRVKKGDFVWLFLDRSRKVGARLGVGEKKSSKARLHWARIGVDDLMLVRGNLILPHHYDFYFFIINKTIGPGGVRVFDYSAEAPEAAVPATSTPPTGDVEEDHSMLEGASDDPSLTKVVDRRWYERNKHIYPANVWQDFDPEQDYTQQVRRDQGGNAYFFASK